jgi:hypothetical protein
MKSRRLTVRFHRGREDAAEKRTGLNAETVNESGAT